MLKAQVDPGVPCLHTQDFQPCMAPGCTVEGKDFIQTQTNGKRGKDRERERKRVIAVEVWAVDRIN